MLGKDATTAENFLRTAVMVAIAAELQEQHLFTFVYAKAKSVKSGKAVAEEFDFKPYIQLLNVGGS